MPFLAGLFLTFFLPGFLFLLAFKPQADWEEKLTFSLPLSLSFNALLGAWANFFGFLLSPHLFLAGLASLGSLSLGRCLTRGPLARGVPERRPLPVFFLLILFTSSLTFLTLTTVSKEPGLPPGDDSLFHLPVLKETLAQRRLPHPSRYAYGMHLNLFFLASLSQQGLLETAKTLSLLTLFFLSLFPLGFFLLIKTLYKDTPSLAFFAALSTLPCLPFFIHNFGMGSHPFLWGLFLTPFFLASFFKLLEGSTLRRSNLLKAVLLGFGLFYTHPSWGITAALILLFLLPLTANYLRPILAFVPLLLLALLPMLGTVFTWLTGQFSPSPLTARWFELDSSRFSALTETFSALGPVFIFYGSYLFTLTLLLGLYLAGQQKRYRPFLFLFLALTFLFLDSSYFGLLNPLYRLTNPWGLWHRLVKIFVFPLALLSGLALFFFWEQLAQKRPALKFTFLAILPFFLLISLLTAAGKTYQYSYLFAPGNLDLRALLWAKDNLPSEAVVLNDSTTDEESILLSRPVDSGGWLPVLADRQALLYYGFYGEKDYTDRLFLLTHLSELETETKVIELLNKFGVEYIYYSSCRFMERKHSLSLDFLQKSGFFKETYAAKGACPDGQPGKVFVFAIGKLH